MGKKNNKNIAYYRRCRIFPLTELTESVLQDMGKEGAIIRRRLERLDALMCRQPYFPEAAGKGTGTY